MSHKPTDTDTQRRIAALVSSIDVSAPASLHTAVRELSARARPARRRPWRRGPVLVAAPLAGAAVLAVVLVLTLGSGSGPPSPPTVLQASALGLRPATLAAPEENPRARGQLTISAAGIPYPYWERRFGWRTTGARSDRLGGRSITTVFYANSSGWRIGYSIVSGRALALPARFVVWHGGRYVVFRQSRSPAGDAVVTWRRAGHTCILVGSGVSAKTLLTLADWQAA